ncbi:hypothetical protein V2J09_005665 [Rumex salicifolius]
MLITRLNPNFYNRAIWSAEMNIASSCSHSVFTIQVNGEDKSCGVVQGRLHLVDLAGSHWIDNSDVPRDGLQQPQVAKSLSCLQDIEILKKELLNKEAQSVPSSRRLTSPYEKQKATSEKTPQPRRSRQLSIENQHSKVPDNSEYSGE